MPSNQNPGSAVNPGPGRLPSGTVPAGSLVPPGGGGGGGGALAALTAHITNPKDAHFASAIGVNPFYPPTGQPILTSVGGVVDGESVLDFINQFKALIPPHPNYIGFNLAAGVTSGIPNWNALATLLTGGYQQGTNVQFSHYLVGNGVTVTGAITGMLFPADRGVVAFYKNTSGNFLDAPNTTLVAALSLNDTAPAGIPDSAFNEINRTTQQVNYTGSGAGLDLFSLTFRYPYLNNYTGYVAPPYGPFSANFPSFQLAVFSLLSQAIGAGDSQNFLVVHWKETYATSLASIQPVNLTLGNLTATNCYSAVPTSNTAYGAGSWDDNTIAAFNVNRHFVFRDTNSAAAPAGTVFTSAPNGVPSTDFLSGVKYYNVASGAGSLTWTVDIRATGLFANSFQTGSTDNPPNVPTQMHSAFDPIQMPFTSFGGGILAVPYYVMNKFGGGVYSNTNSPAPGDTGEYQNATLAIVTPVAFTPVGGEAQLVANLRTPFQETVFTDTNIYLFDSYTPGALPTTVFEPFVDEFYRYIGTFDPTTSATVPVVPAGGNVFPSSTALLSGGADLQVRGHEVVYPQTNYNLGTIKPTQAIDYSGFPGSDGVNHLRRYQRAVDTGVARNTGWIRITGISQASFTTTAAYTGVETAGHLTGGAIVQLKVPGASGSDWLDIGRAFGDPGLVGPLGTSPFYGCQTGVVVNGSDIYVQFQTGSIFTSNNGSGNFLLFVRVTFINGPGTALQLNQIQFYPPTFTPP